MIEKEDVRRSEPERDWARRGVGGGGKRVVKQIAVVISFVTSAKSCRRP